MNYVKTGDLVKITSRHTTNDAAIHALVIIRHPGTLSCEGETMALWNGKRYSFPDSDWKIERVNDVCRPSSCKSQKNVI